MACTPEPSLSLPPNVAGPVRGEVLLCVGQLSLEDSNSPTSVAQEYQVPASLPANSPCGIGEINLDTVAAHELQHDEPQVRIQWWGDRGPGTLVHLLPGHPQALVHFPVCCSSGSVLPHFPSDVAPYTLISWLHCASCGAKRQLRL